MKNKETLEEAVKRLFSKYSNNTSLSEGHYDYLMDEEDFKDASTELVKWQQERMYSKEDLREAFEGGGKMSWADIIQETQEPYYYDFNNWFENFKNK